MFTFVSEAQAIFTGTQSSASNIHWYTVKHKQYSLVHCQAHRWLLLYSEESSRQQLAYNDELTSTDLDRLESGGEITKRSGGGPRRKLIKYGFPVGHVRYINFLTWLLGCFRVKIVTILSFFCLTIPKETLIQRKHHQI